MTEPKIVLSAVDQTRAAFESAKSGLQGLHTSSTSVAGAMTGFATAIGAAALAAKVMGALEAADHLNKLSQRTGVATEQLSQLQFAAKLSDVSAESLSNGIKKLNVSIAEGLGGDKAKVEMFRNLGISLKDASGHAKTADAVMLEMAGAFSTAKDGAIKTAYAVGLMGKSGDEMIPLLNGGSRALAEMMAKADRLGLTISGDFAKRAEEFNDNLTIAKASSDKLAISLADNMVEALGKTAKAMAAAAEKGGILSAVLAGLDVRFNGDAQHKANVELVEYTNKLLDAENQLLQMKGSWMAFFPESIKQQEDYIKFLKDGVAAVLKARKDLAGASEDIGVGLMEIPPDKNRYFKALSGGGAAAQASEYDALIKRINEKIAVQDAELKAGRELTESEKFVAKAIADVDNATKKATVSQMLYVDGKLQAVKAGADLIETHKREAKTMAEAAAVIGKAYDDEQKAIREFADKQKKRDADRLTTGKDMLEQIRFETSLLSMSAAEREQATAKRELERQGIKEGTEAWAEYGEAILKATGQKGELQANIDKFKAGWESVDQTAHDTFVNIFEGGSSVFKKLTQTLKATLLDLLYQMTVRQWIFQIYANVNAGGGIAGAAGGVAMQAGGNLLTSTVGNFLLGGAPAAFTTAYGAASAAAGGAAISSLVANGATIEAAVAASSSAGITAGLGAGIEAGLAAVPVYGWIALAGLAIYSMLGGKGETRSGGQYNMGALIDKPSGGPIGGGVDPARQASAITAISINETLKAIGSSSRLTNFMTGVESSEKGKGFAYAGGTLNTGGVFGQGWGDSFKGKEGINNRRGNMTPEEAMKAFSTELKQSTLQAIQAATDVPESIMALLEGKDFDAMADAELDPILAAVNKVITGVQQFRGVIELLPFDKLAGQSFDFAASLGELSGGMDKFLANLGSYYDNFYSDDEKKAQTRKNIQGVITGAGGGDISGITDRASYRKLVEQYEGKTDEASMKIYAALISVAGAFASITPAVDAAVDGISDAMKGLLADSASLEVALLRAQGDRAGADAAQRTIDTAGMTEAEIALYDHNKAIRDEISALGERQSLEVQLLQLEGNTAELRRRELETLDPSNRALQERIWALQDEQAAAALVTQSMSNQGDIAAAAAQAAYQAAEQWRSTAQTIEEVMARLRGDLNAGTGQSYARAQAEFATATAQARAGDQAAADRLPALAQLLQELGRGRAGNAFEANVATASLLASLSGTMAFIRQFQQRIPAFAGGGDHAGGWAMVGERGPELAYMPPARIYNSGQTASMTMAGNSEVVAQLRSLGEAVAELNAISKSTAFSSRRTAVVLERVTRGGDGMVTTTE